MSRLHWILFKGRNVYFIDTRDTVFGLAEDAANFLTKYEIYRGLREEEEGVTGFAFKKGDTLKKLYFVVSMYRDPESEFYIQSHKLTGEELAPSRFGPGSVVEQIFKEDFVLDSFFVPGITDKKFLLMTTITFRNQITMVYYYCGDQKIDPREVQHFTGIRCHEFLTYRPTGEREKMLSSTSTPGLREWIYSSVHDLYKTLSELMGIPVV